MKEEIKQSDKGGAPGQWSARKAQFMASEYKKRGGGYTDDGNKDESQKNLDKWGEEEWQTKDGSGNAKQSDGTQKRYLPKKAWENMSEKEKEETDDKKQKQSKQGKQFVPNTDKAKQQRKKVSNGNDEASHDDDDDDEEEEEESSKDTKSKSNGNQKKQGKTQQAAKKANGKKTQKKDSNDEEEDDDDDDDEEDEEDEDDAEYTDDAGEDEEEEEEEEEPKVAMTKLRPETSAPTAASRSRRTRSRRRASEVSLKYLARSVSYTTVYAVAKAMDSCQSWLQCWTPRSRPSASSRVRPNALKRMSASMRPRRGIAARCCTAASSCR